MKLNFFNRIFNSMLTRLVFYFVLIICITLSLSSYFTYNFFSSSFKDEVMLVNHKILNQLTIFSDDIILKNINETLISLILDNNINPEIAEFFKDSSIINSELLLQVFKKLDSITLANREFVDSIFIHSKEKRLLISSYYVKEITEDKIYESDELRWINEFYKSNSSLLWMKTRNTKVYSDVTKDRGDIITVICSYPVSSSHDEIKGFIAVNIKESSLNKYLVNFNSMNFGQLLIMDNTGTIISHSEKTKLYSNIADESFVNRILKSKKSEDFVSVFDKGKYVVSYTRSKFNNWYYVSLVPVELFYQRDFYIKQKIFLISLIILFCVFLFSNFFSYKIYTPFRQILDNYKSAGNKKLLSNVRIKEYNMMDSLFNNMSNKIDYLQDTLDKNLSIIRQNLLNDLINNRITTCKDMEDTLRFLNIKFSKKYFVVVIFLIEKTIAQTNQQNNVQFYKHSISDFINSLNNEYSNCYNCIHTSSYNISVIVNTDCPGDIGDFVKQVEDYCYANFNFYLTASVGQIADSPMLIYKSYRYSMMSMQYKFIHPDQYVFHYNDTEKIIAMEITIPDDFAIKLEKYIKLRDYNEVKNVLYKFVAFIKSNNVTPRQVKKEVSEFYALFVQFMSEMSLNFEDITDDEYTKERLTSCDNINEFVELFLQYMQKSFDIISRKKLNKNSDLTEMIKQYVLDNMHTEISLNSTADAFYISSYYLSRIFKKETGMNYINYVVNCKMEKAMDLLISTNLSLEQITNCIGYRHATYFNRKFKEFTGKTPNEYRTESRLKS